MRAVDVEGLAKSYADRTVLHDVSFTISDGETVALLGPNGAGKTTTVEILEGFRQADAGHVRVLGEDPQKASAGFRQRVGVVLQETRHDPFLTVAETVDLVRGWYARPLATEDVLALVALSDAAGQRVAKLSGGQQRRLDVALGLVGQPELVFLDEPTTGFDPAARRDAWQMLGRLRDRGTTVVLTTHYLDEAAALADRLLVLARGRLVADACPTAIGDRNRTHLISFTPAAHLTDDLPPNGVLQGGRWSASVQDVTASVHALSTWAANRNTQMNELTVGRPSLEDVYFELIR
jgi:ABC-2 type transport system ATP-binding protein